MADGAIFDMDGVLVDNVRYHMRAWQQLGRELGKDVTEDQIRRVFGQRNREMIKQLISADLSDEEITQHTTRKEQIYRSIIAADLQPAPGLVEFLRDLQEGGVPCAVATSGPWVNVTFVLDRLGIRDYFRAIVTGADVTNSKPDPEIFLLAARKLQLPPGRCVVFEDSAAGIQAAHRAGCMCIALATTHAPAEIEGPHVARIVPDFTSLAARDIAAM
jgi:beta-phosphoglucomutase family hydrolase